MAEKTEKLVAMVSPEQKSRAEAVSEATGISVAEYIRRGLWLAIADSEAVLEGASEDGSN